jgi:DNA-binding FrmR family transcriptional regulator
MKTNTTRHDENMARLARIEGQVRGVRRMIEDGKYCIDIITQIQAAEAALSSVGKSILKKHMEHCVQDALLGKSKKAASQKIDELIKVMNMKS